MGETPEELFREREKRVSDAAQLREPDRVPVMCHSGFFPAFYAGITCEEAVYDNKKTMAAWTKFLEDFEPDMADNPFSTRFLGSVLDTPSQGTGWFCVAGPVQDLLLAYLENADRRVDSGKLHIDIVGKGGGFIMDTSTVIDDAKPENVKAMYDVAKQYGVYR
jgi:hypothetical protein